MVELSTRKREIRGDGGNHHEKLGHKKISGASQITIHDTAGTCPDPAGNNTDPRSSKPNQEVVPLISQVRSYSPYRSHLYPPSLAFLSTTLPSLPEHKVKSSLSMSPCHHLEWTPSAAYAECSIRRVQHTPSAVYTEYSIHLRLSVVRSFSQFRKSPFPQFRVNQTRNRVSVPGAPPIDRLSIDYLQVLIYSPSIIACCKCISKLDRSQLGVHLCVHSISASKCMSKLARSRPPSASLSSLNLGLQLHLPTCSITASQCISEFTQCWSPIASPTLLDHGLKVRLQTRWIMASECISEFTWSRPRSASLNLLDHGIQVHR